MRGGDAAGLRGVQRARGGLRVMAPLLLLLLLLLHLQTLWASLGPWRHPAGPDGCAVGKCSSRGDISANGSSVVWPPMCLCLGQRPHGAVRCHSDHARCSAGGSGHRLHAGRGGCCAIRADATRRREGASGPQLLLGTVKALTLHSVPGAREPLSSHSPSVWTASPSTTCCV
jgi:hypothetical protein